MTEKLHICAACGYEYENSKQKKSFHDLTEDWSCPECGMQKYMFHHYSCEDLVQEFMGTGLRNRFSTLHLDRHTPTR